MVVIELDSAEDTALYQITKIVVFFFFLNKTKWVPFEAPTYVVIEK